MKCRALALVALLSGTLMCFVGCASKSSSARGSSNKSLAAASPSAAELEQRVAAHAHYATGLHHEINDEPELALQEFLAAIKADSSHEPLVLDVGRRLLQQKRFDEAIAILKTASRQPEASAAADAWLALAYAQNGQTNLAITSNLAALKKEPANLVAYQNLINLYIHSHQKTEAINLANQAAKVEDETADYYIAASGLFARLGELKYLDAETAKARGLELLDRAAALKPEEPLTILRLADGYVYHQTQEKAEALYLDLLRKHPEIPNIREKLAEIYLRGGNEEKARAEVEKLLRNNPTDPQLHLILGSLAARENNLPKAAEHLDTALKLRPELETLYYDLAGLRLSLRQPDEALQLMETARKRFRLSFLIEFYSGVALAMKERYAEALRHLTSAELIAKTSEPARLTHVLYFQLGSVSERSKDYEAAERYFRKCIELDPDHAEALNYLGYMWAERGVNLAEAYAMIEKAVKLEPENPAFLDSLAWVLYQLQRPSEALPPMQKAIEKTETPDATLFDHLGDIYIALNEVEKARDAWEKALKAEPSDTIKEKLSKHPAR